MVVCVCKSVARVLGFHPFFFFLIQKYADLLRIQEKKNLVFNNVSSFTYLQVLFRGTHWLRLWAQLQKDEADGVCLSSPGIGGHAILC
ncbi:hypothetical protein Zm00014a_024522 [Zea mays]|uniref:Uncharacterized protein n=1 Tax=Zea mays TaxID=4577 RepID=A0A3L6G7W7_MAIZE|nr:hypothetical protein Zm00014a_024522 [Zea mays]